MAETAQIDLALRYDRWDNLGASRFEQLGDGSSAVTPFADGSLSPKAGLRVRPLEWLTVRAAAYRALSLAKTRSMSWSKGLRAPAILSAPSEREGLHGRRRQPEHVDDTEVFKTTLSAGFAKQILRDPKPGCRLRRRERPLAVGSLLWHDCRAADHRLTKILVLP